MDGVYILYAPFLLELHPFINNSHIQAATRINMFWKIINPVTIAIAKSPLHFLISQNLVVLNFVGMKTGKNYALPLSYFEDPKGQLSCVTDRRNIWWRNLLHATNIKILYKGRLTDARVTIEHEDNKIIADQLDALCSHSRIDGFFAKVGYENGKPIQKDIEKAASIMTLIQLSIY